MKKLLIVLSILLLVPMFTGACECPEGQVWNGEYCEIPGGTSWVNFVPKVAWHRVSNGVVDWLTSFFGSTVVICDTVSHNYPINVWGQPTDGSPQNIFADMYNGENNYGYGFRFETNGEFENSTYHRVELPSGMSLYCRTLTTTLFGVDVLSTEFFVE